MASSLHCFLEIVVLCLLPHTGICKVFIETHDQFDEEGYLGILVLCDNVWPLGCWADVYGEGIGVRVQVSYHLVVSITQMLPKICHNLSQDFIMSLIVSSLLESLFTSVQDMP